MDTNIKKLKKATIAIKKDPHFRFIDEVYRQEKKGEIFLVGGAVRDIILGKETKDFDFVIRNVKINRLESILKLFGKVNLVGKKFGVFKFVPNIGNKKTYWQNLEELDIALPRQEYSVGNTGHYRDFEIKSDSRLTMEKDLSRRDFTINSMAWDMKNESLVDPFGGQDDLVKKNIRAVGNPARRFGEDYSRMLRAIRFCCQLNFSLNKNTEKAIISLIGQINKTVVVTNDEGKKEKMPVVAREIIAKEMLRSFSYSPLKAFELFDQLQVFKNLIPEIENLKNCQQPKIWHSEGDVFVHTKLAMSHLYDDFFKKEFGDKKISLLLLLAVILHDIGKPSTIQTPEKDGVDRIRFNGHDIIGAKMARDIAARLKFSSVASFDIDPEEIFWLIKNHMLLTQDIIGQIKNNTIEKYFFANEKLGQLLLRLMFVDVLATVRADRQSSLTEYNQLKKRIKEIAKITKKKISLPKPLINGHQIIRALKLAPGPIIGQAIDMVREEQLSGRLKNRTQAINFLKIKLKKCKK